MCGIKKWKLINLNMTWSFLNVKFLWSLMVWQALRGLDKEIFGRKELAYKKKSMLAKENIWDGLSYVKYKERK